MKTAARAAGMAGTLSACLSALPGLCLFLGLQGCLDSQRVASGGSVTEAGNGQVSARVVGNGGIPVAGAAVYLRESGYVKDTSEAGKSLPAADALTDGNGAFSLPLGGDASYKIEVRDSARKGALFSFTGGGPGKMLDLGTDTARAWGVLTGKTELPGEQPGRSFIQVLGLERVVETDSSGYFTIADLPPGLHLLRAVSARSGYSYPGPIEALIRPGDTLRLPPIKLITFAEEDYSQWPYSRGLEIHPTVAGIADSIFDFPLLVRLDGSRFDFRLSDGKDLRFTGPGGRKLAYQIDHWDPAREDAAIWVRLDTIAPKDTGLTVTMHWGKRDCPDFSDGASVFPSFAGVWHMSEAAKATPGAYYRDASPSRADAKGTILPDTGYIGPAAGFKGTQELRVAGRTSFRPDSQLTISAWVRADSSEKKGAFFASFGEDYGLWLMNNAQLSFWVATDTTHVDLLLDKTYLRDATGSLWNSGWRYVAGSYDGVTMRLFVDGEQIASLNVGKPILYPDTNDLVIGQHGSEAKGYALHGAIDEMQLSAHARSKDWIKLSYENQRLGSRLIEFK